MKDETYKLIKDWFNSKTGITLVHDPSLVSLVNEIEALRIHDVVGQSEQLKALLEKLLENNMCSHAGDELIEEALKGF